MQLIEKAECPADEEEDFLEDLKKSMGTTNNNINNNNNKHNTAGVKGNTFKMLQVSRLCKSSGFPLLPSWTIIFKIYW